MDIDINLDAAKRRLRGPLIVLALVLLVLGATNLIMLDVVGDSRERLDQETVQIAKLRRLIRDLNTAMERYDQNLPLYDRIVATGFLETPDLIQAELNLRRAAELNELNRVVFEIGETEILALDGLAGTTARMRTSEIQLRAESLLDGAIFGYIASIQERLPGLVLLRDLEVERTTRTMAPVVEAIMAGPRSAPPSLFRARVTLDWVTLEITESSDAALGG